VLLVPLSLLVAPVVQAPVQEPPPEAPVAPQAAPAWSTSLETYFIDPPGEDGYLSAILSADRDRLHLEARWAYEDRDTASLNVGWAFPWEGELHGSLTPMIGYAAGQTDGVVTGVNIELGWKKLAFTSAAEYLIATSDDSQDFLYDWSELTWAVSERFTIGLVGQRTNVFDQELSVDRGLLVGLTLGRTYLTAYLFNPDQDDPYLTFALGAGF
jgi:hypothetical protein